ELAASIASKLARKTSSLSSIPSQACHLKGVALASSKMPISLRRREPKLSCWTSRHVENRTLRISQKGRCVSQLGARSLKRRRSGTAKPTRVANSAADNVYLVEFHMLPLRHSLTKYNLLRDATLGCRVRRPPR